MKMRALATLFGVALLAGACADGRLIETVEKMEPKEKGFKANLQHQYVTLAKIELEEGDRYDAGVFARRAEAAAMGKDVDPDILWDRHYSAKQLDELIGERSRLVYALDSGGRKDFPGIAARAQTQFDCWAQELEENTQPDDIAKCRNGYMLAMQSLDEMMKPSPAEKEPEPAKPAPVAMPEKGPFNVYFEFDSDEVRGAEAGVALVKAANSIRENKISSVVVVGHTDSAGRDGYNQALALRRAENVKEVLVGLDVNPDIIEPVSVGESGQEKPTGDGVREDANRRVVIRLY
ncbi:MAG: OmpA family protein [Alphaproteobacteria bacterium]